MERTELLEFLRERLSISVTLERNYESHGEFIRARVSLELDREEIASDFDSVNVS